MTHRDPKKVAAREAEQQRLVEGIMRSLHEHVKEYPKDFIPFAVIGMAALQFDDCLSELEQTEAETRPIIVEPIRDFTQNEVERRLLLGLVVKRLFDPVLQRLADDYRDASYEDDGAAEHS